MAKQTYFKPVTHLDDSNCFVTHRFLKATDQNDASLVYVGELVRILASGEVARLTPAQVTAAVDGTFGALGVVARVLVNEAGRPRVHGLSQSPQQHPNISLSGDADFLDVYVDPQVVYQISVDGSAGRSLIGQTVGLVATARTTAAGIPGVMLDTSVSASSFLPIKIIGIADSELASRAGSVDGKVQCVLNHQVTKVTRSF